MNTLQPIASTASQIGLDAGIKSVVVLGLAIVLTSFARYSSAAVRHRIWSLALVCCLLLPAGAYVLPQFQLPILPQQNLAIEQPTSESSVSFNRIPLEPKSIRNDAIARNVETVPAPLAVSPLQPLSGLPSTTTMIDGPQSAAPAVRTADAVTAPSHWWPLTICSVWLLGFVLVASALGSAMLDVRRRCVRSTPAPTEWLKVLEDIATRIRITKRVSVYCDPTTTIPIAAGIIRPVILMPTTAEDWSQQRREYALLHELVHVERRDVLWQFIAQLVSAFYWFNPLVWLAIRQLRSERECACDDQVVQITGRASDYATQLLGIARSARAVGLMSPAVAMAQASELEKRLRSMFDRARSHLPLSRKAAMRLAVIFALLLLLVASVKPVARILDSELLAQTEDVLPSDDAPADLTEMQVNVLDHEGKPISGATIHVSIWELDGNPQRFPNRDFTTNDSGTVSFTRPREVRILRLWASHSDHVTLFAGFEEGTHGDGRRLPKEFTFKLPQGIDIGGQVVDESGEPVVGAKVEARLDELRLDDRLSIDGNEPNVRFNPWLATESDAAVSGSDGHWVVKNVPKEFDKDGKNRVWLKFNHPDFIFKEERRFGSEALRSLAHETTLKRGIRPEGIIRDPTGNPVAGALVIRGEDPYFEWGSQEVITDEQGYYQFPSQAPGKLLVTVVAKGWMPQMREVEVSDESNRADFQLEQGLKLSLKIVDQFGKPVSQCYVSVHEWRGKKSLYNHHHPNVIDSQIPLRANEQGIYEWDWAPADPVTFGIGTRGFIQQELELTPSSEQQVISLKSQARIVGNVSDATTGQPIEEFTVYPTIVFRENQYVQDMDAVHTGSDGKFSTMLYRTDVQYRLLVEAEGYRRTAGKPFHVADGEHQENFKLEPAPVIKGRILDPQGRLLKGANVHLATMLTPLQFNADSDYMARPPFVTGESGYFQFAAPDGPYTLVVTHPDGYRRLEFDKDEQPGQIRLQRWARIEGTLRQNGQPVPDATILLNLPPERDEHRYIVREARQVRTYENGQFLFPMVPPARVVVRPFLSVWQESPITSSHHLPMDLKPGEKVVINLGSDGVQVSGRVRLEGDVPANFDLNYSLNYLIRRESALAPPDELKAVAEMAKSGWTESLIRSAEGQRYLDLHDRHFVRLTSDGNFLISGATPGQYEFVFSIYERPQGCLIDPIAVKIVPVTIDQAALDAGSLALPDIRIPFPERLHVGSSLPDLTLRPWRGDSIKLSKFQGRPMLVHGWATYCKPCLEWLPRIKQLRADYGPEKLSIVGINLDEDGPLAGEYASREGLEWDHVFVGLRSEVARRFGFTSIPSYIVVSADGKLVLQTNEWNEAEEKLKSLLAE